MSEDIFSKFDLSFIKKGNATEVYSEWGDLEKLFPEAADLLVQSPINYDAVRQVVDDFLCEQVDNLAAASNSSFNIRDGDVLADIIEEIDTVYIEATRAFIFCTLTSIQHQNELGVQKAIPLFSKVTDIEEMLGTINLTLYRELGSLSKDQIDTMLATSQALQAYKETLTALIEEGNNFEKYANPLNIQPFAEAVDKLNQVAKVQYENGFASLNKKDRELMAEGLAGVIQYRQEGLARSGISSATEAFLKSNRLSETTFNHFFEAAGENADSLSKSANSIQRNKPDSQTIYSWQEARDIVVESFSKCHPEMGEVAAKAFDENWIYAVSKGVENAHALGGLPAHDYENGHPYAAVNFNGTLESARVLAHEMGHVVHNYLAGQNHGIGDMSAKYVLQETPSHFGEMLVRNYLIQKAPYIMEELAIATTFAIPTLQNFMQTLPLIQMELGFYDTVAQHGTATTYEQLEAVYRETMKPIAQHGCLYQLDTYFLRNNRVPLTIAAYPIPALLASSLSEQMQSDPEFGSKFMEVLKAGGTITPEQAWNSLLGEGKVQSQEFWQEKFTQQSIEMAALAKEIQQFREIKRESRYNYQRTHVGFTAFTDLPVDSVPLLTLKAENVDPNVSMFSNSFSAPQENNSKTEIKR